MDNHDHLIIETLDGNLSKSMWQLNGVVYTQVTKRRHGHDGHLFQGQYKAILVDKARYLLELSLDVVLYRVSSLALQQMQKESIALQDLTLLYLVSIRKPFIPIRNRELHLI